MASSVPFAFDVDKLTNFINGDLGIADAIHKAQIAPLANKAKTKEDKATFNKVSEPNKKTGLWAIERAFISSSLETQKPYIELIKICLELFGHLDVVKTKLTGGSNPLNNPDSMINAFNKSSKSMDKIKTGYEQKNPNVDPNATLPTTLYLSTYIDNAGVSPIALNVNNGGVNIGSNWPQYTSYDEFYNEQINEILLPKISTLDKDEQKQILDGRLETIADEWKQMENDNQIKKTNLYGYFNNDNYHHYFKPQIITYLGKQVEIDPEEDYDIHFSFTDLGQNNGVNVIRYDITATLKEQTNGNKAKPEFYVPNLVGAVKYFIKKALNVIISKLIPVINALKKVISKPVEFVGDIFLTKIKEHFEMLDPGLKHKDPFDKDRRKYWTTDGKFTLDGSTALSIGLLNITIGLKDAVPTFKVGKETLPKNNVEPPPFKTVANLVALPINFLKGILDIFVNLFKNLFSIVKIPKTILDFLTFKDFKDLLSIEKILEFLGAEGGDIKKLPLLSIPKDGNISLVPEMILSFLKMIIQFINGFIGIPNTIMNFELVPPIPIPS